MKLTRPHHQDIWEILLKFNHHYLTDNAILFGGGTRIALELAEYRESVDIDFLCANPTSYKAVRSQVTSHSFGELLKPGEKLTLHREIRSDRDAVRAFVEGTHGPIKLEFIHCDYYDLQKDGELTQFPVPCIDQTSCFLTKLLANADRYANPDKKDIFDLCMMAHFWKGIPESAWEKADKQYGLNVVYHGLQAALKEMADNRGKLKNIAIRSLSIDAALADIIVDEYAQALHQITINHQHQSKTNTET